MAANPYCGQLARNLCGILVKQSSAAKRFYSFPASGQLRILPVSAKRCPSNVARKYSSDASSSSSQVPPHLALNFIRFPDLSEEDQHRFNILQYELDVLRQSGERAPENVSEKNWREVLKMTSKHQRLRYFNYLFKIEMLEKAEQKKREERKLIRDVKHQQLRKEVEENPDVIRYGLNFNTMFPYIRDTSIVEVQNIKLARARVLGQPLVFDCDYEEWMSERERINTAVQLRDSYAENKESRDPFWIQFCNLKKDGSILRHLRGAIPNIGTPTCLIETSEKDYLELFPKEKLVYLTYNAEETLTTFNHDDIYIIGALVDKTHPKPLSMAKAKRQRIRMAKLPLDVHLRWAIGGKNLTINQVTGIMCEAKDHGDFHKALLKHIPKRKYLQPGDIDPNSGEEPYHKELLNDRRFPDKRPPGLNRPFFNREQRQSVMSSLRSSSS